MHSRSIWLGVIAVLVVIGLAGCGQSGSGTPGTADQAAVPETPVEGDWVVTHLEAEMEHLNPYTSTDYYSAIVLSYLFDGLLTQDYKTFEMKSNLAESYEISEDHLSYTFHLRPGICFSDGTPVTVDDIKFSFDTIKNPKVDAIHLRNYYEDVTACEIVDPQTVRFTCSKPYFKHLQIIGLLLIIPKHIYETGDFNTHPNNRNPIGSGPYQFEKWDTGQQVVLTRNENYWKTEDKPYIKKQVYKFITDQNAAFQVLMRQEIDLMTRLTPEDWVTRANTPAFLEKFEKYSYYQSRYTFIGWNSQRPMFQDKMVRRAMTMLLNREELRETIYHGLAKTVSGNFFIDSPEYNKNIAPWPFDPEGAKKILDEADWKDTNNDGVREKGSTPFKFELLITSGNTTAEQIATIFQEELKRAGIEMTIRPLEWATFLKSTDERTYDATMLGWHIPPDADPYQVWHSSQIENRGSNFVGFKNGEGDKIIEDARIEFDKEKRMTLYHRFHEIVHEEEPYTFLFCPEYLLAIDKRFRNVNIYPLGPETREWWVPEPLQRYHE